MKKKGIEPMEPIAEIATPKKEKVKKDVVKLVSYTVKATIPTGPYANVCPEITVSASSIEAAERVVLPYIEKMYATYLGGVPKNVEAPVVTKVETQAPTSDIQLMKAQSQAPVAEIKGTTLPVTSTQEAKFSEAALAPAKPVEPKDKWLENRTEPFLKAYNALKSNKTTEGLDVILNQIRASKRLTQMEIDELSVIYLDLIAAIENAARRVS